MKRKTMSSLILFATVCGFCISTFQLQPMAGEAVSKIRAGTEKRVRSATRKSASGAGIKGLALDVWDTFATHYSLGDSTFGSVGENFQEPESKVWAWGYNPYGLGDGSSTESSTPVQVSGLRGAIAIAAGSWHSLAVKSNGTVWAWGGNDSGQLGIGSQINKRTPVQVPGVSGATVVAAGLKHSLALKGDGTVLAWGYNRYGQLGNGTNADSNSPVAVAGLSGVSAVAGGTAFSLALKGDGTVWSWGTNSSGQLGDGGSANSNTPVLVSGLSGVIAIAAGGDHSLALKGDGTVWAWGYNDYGQLGNGSRFNSNIPVPVSNLTGIVRLGAGYGHSLAIKGDGTAWAWGVNGGGQLGVGNSADCDTPTQVSGPPGYQSITGGWLHSIATKGDGTAWAWGDNYRGQLGSSDVLASGVPVPVAGLSGATDAAAGWDHSLAMGGSISCSIDCTCSVPLAGMASQPVSFEASESHYFCDGMASFEWDFGDGTAHGTIPTASHLYLADGTFTWTLTVGLPGGTKCSKTGQITIEKPRDEITLMLPGNVPLHLVRIPAGNFEMGSPDTESGRYPYEGPVHQVNISRDFYLGKCEVTLRQWEALMGSSSGHGSGEGPSYPVFYISWDDIAGAGNEESFLNKLDAHLSATGQGGMGRYRLPTEAEWEYACRAGSPSRYSFGDSLDCDDGCGVCPLAAKHMWWCGDVFPEGSKPVELLLPNAFGLYDMHGNSSEYCQDNWHEDYTGAPTDGRAWETPSERRRVTRSGGGYAQSCRSAFRNMMVHTSISYGIGFRLAADDFLAPGCLLTCEAHAARGGEDTTFDVNFSCEVGASGCIDELQYSWDFGDGSVSVERNPTHNYLAPGPYNWSFKVTSGTESCSKSGVVSTAPVPGDCDDDGSVSIAELQKAINMFLGATHPDCGVDCDGDGAVSICELQRVVNAFLGLQSSC